MLIDEAKIKNDLAREEERFQNEIATLRTGRPSLKVFETIFVEYYGAQTAVTFLGSPTQNGLNITWKIFDKSMTTKVADAILAAEIGASVNQSDAATINVNFVPMTQEVRMEKVKELRGLLEEAKIKVRQNVRRKYMEELDSLEKVPEDEKKRSEEQIQALVDKAIKNLEEISKSKEIEVMSV